jgi:1-aminocyclopropane-1-carboxylate deaminase
VELAHLPTPIQFLPRLTAELGGPEVWIKRDDLTGLPGGGNKTRKLEYLVGDALAEDRDTLVTVGAIQSNHTRQTAGAAAKLGLKCALLHCRWTADAGPLYRQVGNPLLSTLLGAELYLDDTPRDIGDERSLRSLVAALRARGDNPYVIPGGGSDHRLGGLGYARCAIEVVEQSQSLGVSFDAAIHCTGSGSTQAGLVAGFSALGVKVRVVGISDDNERVRKRRLVARLANSTLRTLKVNGVVERSRIEVITADSGPYGVAGRRTLDAIELLASTEGIIADPVYEGKAVRGLIDLVECRVFGRGDRVLLLHLGGSPAVDAYAGGPWRVNFQPLEARPSL